MKLSISTEALNRLLGGDTELEIELRHQVAKQFTKDHLLPLVNSEAFKAVMKEISNAAEGVRQVALDEIRREIGTFKQDRWHDPLKLELVTKIKELVQECARNAVKNSIDEIVKNHIAYYERTWTPHIDKKVKEAFDKNIEKQIQERIEARLKVAAMSMKGAE